MTMRKKALAVVTALSVIAGGSRVDLCNRAALASEGGVEISINVKDEGKEISPLIYGINTGAESKAKNGAKALRVGGNRMTAYNWENNYSNAGSDYKHNSDDFWVGSFSGEERRIPGKVALEMSSKAKKNGIPYKLFTLQMQGYVSADGNGEVSEDEAAPSARFKEVKYRKEAPFSDMPDTEDDYVYMDEYLNYLIKNLGNSGSETGIQAYALDNEPALWKGTHPRIQKNNTLCSELIEKSVELAGVVKEADANAEVFGPALYGYMAFVSLQDANDWKTIKKDNDYRWFIDYYLDEMRKASDAAGTRLLDVLDLHYYTEQKGACGERSCEHYDRDDCIRARFDSYRSLYDPDFKENSWIGDNGAEFFPLLPNIQQSIDKYYPGTKIGFTEYNFGAGDHISGAIAEADALGTFAKYGVYFATIWQNDAKCDYQINTIRLFANYDGEGHGFGNRLLPAESSDKDMVSVYAAKDNEDNGRITVVLTNKNIHEATAVDIRLDSDAAYSSVKAYGLTGESVILKKYGEFGSIEGNVVSCKLPAMSVTELVIESAENGGRDSVADKEENGAPATESSISDPDGKKNNGTLSTVLIICGIICGIIAVVTIAAGLKKKKDKRENGGDRLLK